MRRFAHIASLLSLVLSTGCGQDNPSGSWDANPKTWDAAPPRQIVEGDGGVDPGANPGEGTGGSGSFTKKCTMQHQPWCCYDGRNGSAITGIPLCTWQGIGPGEAFMITEANQANKVVPLPNPLTLRVVTPDKIGSGDECSMAPVGFVLEGKGLVEEPVQSNLWYYFINSDGTWAEADYMSGVMGLVVPRNPDLDGSRTGGEPTPGPTMSSTICAARPSTRANVLGFDNIRFKMDGEEYVFGLQQSGGGITFLYATVERTY
jgi:hypothetical protein